MTLYGNEHLIIIVKQQPAKIARNTNGDTASVEWVSKWYNIKCAVGQNEK